MSKLSDFLRQTRTRRGWSLRDTAQRSGLSNGYISLLENGRVESPSASVLAKLARAFEVSLNDILHAAGVSAPLPRAGHEDLEPELLGALRQLTDDERADVASYANYLATKSGGRRRRRGRGA